MKKFFYLIVLTIAVFATSCESHEDDNKFSEKIGLNQLYSVTMGNKTTLYKPVMFTYELNYNEGTADITINGVQFSPMMPAITMEIEDIRFTKTISGIKLNATNIVPEVDDKPIPEYTISSLNCRIASSQILNFSIAELSFVVNNSITVNVSSPTLTFEHESQTDVRKVLSSNSNDDFHFNNASYAIYLNPDNNLAQVYVFNMKFAEKMPAMNMIFNAAHNMLTCMILHPWETNRPINHTVNRGTYSEFPLGKMVYLAVYFIYILYTDTVKRAFVCKLAATVREKGSCFKNCIPAVFSRLTLGYNRIKLFYVPVIVQAFCEYHKASLR